MIKAILFDMFGVLSCQGDGLTGTAEIRKNYPGHDNEIHELFRAGDLGEIDEHEFARRFARIVGISAAAAEKYLEGLRFSEVANRPLLDIITHLRHAGYKTGVISNTRQGRFDAVFPPDVARRYFDSVTLSFELGFAKPEARIYECALKSLGATADEAIFVDDHIANIRGAEAVGMKGILYRDIADFARRLETMLK
jgi:putative hydrolase of the HAD superfamily